MAPRDRLVGMEADLAVLLAPDEADRQAAAQFAAGGLVANAAVQARAQDMQLGLAHGALEAEQQTIVEQRGMIDAVGIADQGVGEAAEIEQAIPIGVVAREARDFEAEHDADVASATSAVRRAKPVRSPGSPRSRKGRGLRR